MRRPRHILARFEDHSLALFAALVMCSASVTAQTREPGPAAEGTVILAQATAPVGKPTSQRHASADEAFGRADSDGDGKLSRDEAQRFPVVWERFDDIDANKDRFISRDEFHRGIAN